MYDLLSHAHQYHTQKHMGSEAAVLHGSINVAETLGKCIGKRTASDCTNSS